MTVLSIRQQIGAALCGCALSLTCHAQTEDPADWLPTPEGLRRMADYFPHETVAGGDHVYALQWGEPLPQAGPNGLDLETFNRDNRSTGMIVLHRGRIVYEGYWLGADAESHFNSWSMAKSVTGTLIGIAEAEGLIASIEDPIVRYVPELADTAYRDVTIEQSLQMSSGLRFSETEEAVAVSCLALPPGPIFADCDPVRAEFGNLEGLLLSLDERAAPPGTRFQYSSVDTQVLAWVLKNATGRPPAEYLSEKIWRPLGMEDDAEWLIDGPGGLPLAGISLNARLRDFARFGLLMLNDGMLDGKRILPKDWVERATTPSKPYLERLDPQIFSYQYQWWVIPDGLVVPNGSGAFEAEGIQGQFLHVDPQHELVVAMTSHWLDPTGWDIPKAMAFHATVASIVHALGYE
jgi:CubicO group peptidase (beta-lactamase class C family)